MSVTTRKPNHTGLWIASILAVSVCIVSTIDGRVICMGGK